MGERVVTLFSCYPELQALMEPFLENVKTVLGERLVGLYLHGSLATGDFNPQTSDVDFLVVTSGRLATETFLELKKMHARLYTSNLAWSQKLEGAYIPRNELRRHDPAHSPVAWLGVDGHFALETLGSDWVIQRWILREKGVVVAGPPLEGMIDPVSAADLQEAVRGSLQEWWSPPFPSPERFDSREYQVYVILTMCRSLYVLANGCIASKPAAARWAMETLGEPWTRLVSEALARQKDAKNSYTQFETNGIINYTLSREGILPEEKT
jgi:predicted nucleotidyltransferase